MYGKGKLDGVFEKPKRQPREMEEPTLPSIREEMEDIEKNYIELAYDIEGYLKFLKAKAPEFTNSEFVHKIIEPVNKLVDLRKELDRRASENITDGQQLLEMSKSLVDIFRETFNDKSIFDEFCSFHARAGKISPEIVWEGMRTAWKKKIIKLIEKKGQEGGLKEEDIIKAEVLIIKIRI
ncbi:MAG: hypothetical protein WC705_02765 [Candidatus Paceibacterota bacterium]|jgi:hypothetical protein